VSDRTNFADVYFPGGGPFFEEHGLLYRSIEELDHFGDHLARVQPIIGELQRDRSVGNLASLIQAGLEQLEDPNDHELWSVILDRVGQASVEIYREYPIAVSWEDLMLQGSAIETVTGRVVLAHPVLDFNDALPARAPLAALRAVIDELGLGPDRGVRVRVTGNPALVHEETLSLVWDTRMSESPLLADVPVGDRMLVDSFTDGLSNLLEPASRYDKTRLPVPHRARHG
jgi:hypothetical protein